MAASNWKRSFELMLKSEGTFTADPRDPGNRLPDGRSGSTMLGVTQHNWEQWIGHKVTHDQMRKLTPKDVAPFYKRKYWDACKCDDLPEGLDYLVFDFAVNAGPGRSIKTLQTAVGTTPDGIIGPKTLAAVRAVDPHELIEKFSVAKTEFYESLPTFATFGRGWLNRVADVKVKASMMVA